MVSSSVAMLLFGLFVRSAKGKRELSFLHQLGNTNLRAESGDVSGATGKDSSAHGFVDMFDEPETEDDDSETDDGNEGVTKKPEVEKSEETNPLTPVQIQNIIDLFSQEIKTPDVVDEFCQEFIAAGGTFIDAKDGALTLNALLANHPDGTEVEEETQGVFFDAMKKFRHFAPSGTMTLEQFIAMAIDHSPEEASQRKQLTKAESMELKTDLEKRKCLDKNKLMMGLATAWPGGLATEEELGPCPGCEDVDRIWSAGIKWRDNKKLPKKVLKRLIKENWPPFVGTNESDKYTPWVQEYQPCLQNQGELILSAHGILNQVRMYEDKINLDRYAESIRERIDRPNHPEALKFEYFTGMPCVLNPDALYDILLVKWNIPIKVASHRILSAASVKDMVFNVWKQYPFCLAPDSSGDEDFRDILEFIENQKQSEVGCLGEHDEMFCRHEHFGTELDAMEPNPLQPEEIISHDVWKQANKRWHERESKTKTAENSTNRSKESSTNDLDKATDEVMETYRTKRKSASELGQSEEKSLGTRAVTALLALVVLVLQAA